MINNQLSQERQKLFHPLSKLLFYGYVILSLLTVFLIQSIDWIRELYHRTELIVLVNAVWFGFGISLYGLNALRKNIKRAKLLNLEIKLDTQFLIVSAFTLFALKQIIDLFLFINSEISTDIATAWRSGGKILEFGGFMSGLASIYSSRRK